MTSPIGLTAPPYTTGSNRPDSQASSSSPSAPAPSFTIPAGGGGNITFNFNIDNGAQAPAGASTGVSTGQTQSPLAGPSTDTFTPSSQQASQQTTSSMDSSATSAGTTGQPQPATLGGPMTLGPEAPGQGSSTSLSSSITNSTNSQADDVKAHLFEKEQQLQAQYEAGLKAAEQFRQLRQQYQVNLQDYLDTLKQVNQAAYAQYMAETGQSLGANSATTSAGTLAQDPLALPAGTSPAGNQYNSQQAFQPPANMNPVQAGGGPMTLAPATPYPTTGPGFSNSSFANPGQPMLPMASPPPSTPTTPGAGGDPLAALGLTPEAMQQMTPDQLMRIANSPEVKQALAQELQKMDPQRRQAIMQAAQQMAGGMPQG